MEETDNQSLASRLADGISEDYTLEGEIGRGGMGVVYLARDLQLKRRVAIKVLPPELAYRSEIKTRFIREAQTAARLSHPHIVPIHGVGEANGLVYFSMGYVDGESLGARLKRRGKLPIEEVRRITKETADALGMAHTMGIIHRDVKPDNILLDGTRRRVMVTDFGIAKALSDVGSGTLTGTGVAIGTPTYMSPEQAAGEGEIDARSDLYALGIVAYEMITGRVPFKATSVPAILMKQITEPPPELTTFRPECPEELSSTIMRLLEKDPEERWPTAESLRRALDSRNPGPARAPRPRRSKSNLERESPRASSSRRRSREEEEEQEPRRPSTRERPSRSRSRRASASRRDANRPKPPVPTRRPRKPAGSKKRELEKKKDESGEPGVVRRFRGHFATYVAINGGIMFADLLTGPGTFFPAVAGIWGIFLAKDYAKVWAEGYSWRDVIDRPPAADALAAVGSRKRVQARVPMPEPSTGDFGKLAGQIQQIHSDRKAILLIVDRLSESEAQLLPDILPTVDSLTKRAVDLATTLHSMDEDLDFGTADTLDARIVAAEAEPEGKERDRRLELLKRQRKTVADLVDRRKKVETQFESCVLAIQNMRFDLLRLRSAGVAAVLDDLTMVTQQAKALNIDINAAIEAAGEIKEVLSAPRRREPTD
jgi:serine/threonine protein kinase